MTEEGSFSLVRLLLLLCSRRECNTRLLLGSFAGAFLRFFGLMGVYVRDGNQMYHLDFFAR